ncbi:MAG: AAA family ATPase [Bacteroidaceae bacterium]|nr:AAA family ATPase [Bacteroidaceae bacterium]
MRNISKLKRLISGFKRQNRLTIQSHLDTMAEDPAVYSEHLKGIGPYLKDNDIYLYIDHMCMVVVCLDKYENKDELADEDSYNGENPLYFTASSYRISPVWQLSETMKLIEQKLKEAAISLKMQGVLLSGSIFSNAEDMERIWKEKNVTVIDHLDGLADWTIGVNNDDELMKGAMVMEAIKDMLTPPSTVNEEEDSSSDDLAEDFERLLNDFINNEMDHGEEDTEDEEDQEDQEDTEDEEDEEAYDFLSGEDDDPLSDIRYPTGIIEQNHNISVRVDILRPIANPREELDKLVGCDDIKRRMDELVALTRYNKMMHELFPDSKQHEVSLHSVFLGHPGTGKTTVCKIFGSLLRQAGALSKGHVVVCDRGSFIGTLWGDEERAMKQVLDMAQGGVLMIDEAYLLNGKHENDPGKLVIQLMMNILADETQRDIAIVLCGYKEPMMKLLDMNPGLQSRFPNKFEFKDFTVDELLEITLHRIKDYDYQFTNPAWEKYRGMLAQAYMVRDPETWGNARFVANQLERIYIQHASRCVNQHPQDKHELLTLIPEDILPFDIPRRKARIGF